MLSAAPGFKREHLPPFAASFDSNRLDRLAGEFRNCPFPKLARGTIGLHHANLPAPRKSAPYCVSGRDPNSTPPVAARDKKLRHVPDRRIAGCTRSSLYQSQTCQFAIRPDKKGVPAGLKPIKREIFVAEPAVRSQLQFEKFAEIVCVQLQKIRQYGLLVACRGNNFDLRRSPLCVSCQLAQGSFPGLISSVPDA